MVLDFLSKTQRLLPSQRRHIGADRWTYWSIWHNPGLTCGWTNQGIGQGYLWLGSPIWWQAICLQHPRQGSWSLSFASLWVALFFISLFWHKWRRCGCSPLPKPPEQNIPQGIWDCPSRFLEMVSACCVWGVPMRIWVTGRMALSSPTPQSLIWLALLSLFSGGWHFYVCPSDSGMSTLPFRLLTTSNAYWILWGKGTTTFFGLSHWFLYKRTNITRYLNFF